MSCALKSNFNAERSIWRVRSSSKLPRQSRRRSGIFGHPTESPSEVARGASPLRNEGNSSLPGRGKPFQGEQTTTGAALGLCEQDCSLCSSPAPMYDAVLFDLLTALLGFTAAVA